MSAQSVQSSMGSQKLEPYSPLEKWVLVALVVGIFAGIILATGGISSYLVSQGMVTSSLAQATILPFGSSFGTAFLMSFGPVIAIGCLFVSASLMRSAKRAKSMEEAQLTPQWVKPSPQLFIDDAAIILLPILSKYADDERVSPEDLAKIKAMVHTKMAEEVQQRIYSLFAEQLPQEQQSELPNYVRQITEEYGTKRGEMGGDQTGEVVEACNGREDRWRGVFDYIGLITNAALGVYSTFAWDLSRQHRTKTEVIQYYQGIYEQLHDLEGTKDLSYILPQ